MPNCLTNTPLPPFYCRHVEDVGLVACVRFVVGLNVNGELLNKGASVSERAEATKSIKQQNKVPTRLDYIRGRSLPWLWHLLLNSMAQEQDYFFYECQHPLTAEGRKCVSHAHLLYLRQSCHWIYVSTGTCSLSISWHDRQGRISVQHLPVGVFVWTLTGKHWHPESEGPSTSNSL